MQGSCKYKDIRSCKCYSCRKEGKKNRSMINRRLRRVSKQAVRNGKFVPILAIGYGSPRPDKSAKKISV